MKCAARSFHGRFMQRWDKTSEIQHEKKSITQKCLINCTSLKTLIISCVMAYWQMQKWFCVGFLPPFHSLQLSCTDCYSNNTITITATAMHRLGKQESFSHAPSIWSHMCMPSMLCVWVVLHANGRQHIIWKIYSFSPSLCLCTGWNWSLTKKNTQTDMHNLSTERNNINKTRKIRQHRQNKNAEQKTTMNDREMP